MAQARYAEKQADARKIGAVAKLMIRDVRAGDIKKFPSCWEIGDVPKTKKESARGTVRKFADSPPYLKPELGG